MSTAQLSMIAPPPSVEAVLGALTEETRIGQVDFSTRLAPETQPDDEPEDVDATGDGAASTDDAEDPDGTDTADDDESGHDDPDEGEAAEPVRTGVVTLVSVPALRDEVEDAPATEPAGADPAVGDQPDEPEELEDAPADADVDVPTVEAPTATGTQETLVLEAVVPASLEERIHEPARLRRSEAPATPADADERPPTVEEIARLVIERMHDAELAMMRHLESIEVEAARRAELLAAQAELDAELIRLNARREAHGIVTAARVRAGEDATAATEDTRLDDLAESLSRFAEVVDELHPAGARTPGWGRTP